MGFADRSYNRAPFGRSGGFGKFRGLGGSGGFASSLTPWVRRLLILNFGIWLLQAAGVLPSAWLYGLAFDPQALITRPWTPFTYMFVHGGFWHVLFNMVGVFFFGPPLERLWGERAFIRFYLVCGLGAAAASLLLLPLIGPHSVIGASGAVFGLLLAFALRWPDQPIYLYAILPIKAKWFVLGITVLSLIATYRTASTGLGDGVAHWTHLGGFLTAYLYLRFQETGRWLPGFKSRKSHAWKVSRGGKAGGSGSKSRPGRPGGRQANQDENSTIGADKLDRVDLILDKIRESGLDSLTADERAFLDEMSRRYRGS